MKHDALGTDIAQKIIDEGLGKLVDAEFAGDRLGNQTTDQLKTAITTDVSALMHLQSTRYYQWAMESSENHMLAQKLNSEITRLVEKYIVEKLPDCDIPLVPSILDVHLAPRPTVTDLEIIPLEVRRNFYLTMRFEMEHYCQTTPELKKFDLDLLFRVDANALFKGGYSVISPGKFES